ncbi:hypothetical protein L1887_15738 [Cichorium endivia]|nr:hypothetical protein L1887_15738 [Cichorium endivia]
MTMNFRCPKKEKSACLREFVVEMYWLKRLVLWQVHPIGLRICNRRCRKLAHGVKFKMLGLCIEIQKGLVFSCKMVRFVSIFFVRRFLRLRKDIRRDNSVPSNESEMKLGHNPHKNLSPYVIYLDGEEGFVDLMTENNSDATAH